MQITLKTMRMLVLMENSPRNGAQLMRQEPGLFASPDSQRIALSATVYKMLDAAKEEGLVERCDYRLPASLERLDKRGGRRVWWRLTPKGRAELQNWREMLKEIPIKSPKATALVGSQTAARRKLHAGKN